MYKVLLITDAHFRDSDMPSVKGYLNALEKTFKEIIVYVIKHKVTHVIFMGDIFDRGYHNLLRMESHLNLIRVLGRHCELYGLVGNHFFLNRDRNPEMVLYQPNNYPEFQPVVDIHTTGEPIVKLVDKLVLGCMQFSFFHFSKKNKVYVAPKEDGVLYHHGLFHDHSVLPSQLAGYEIASDAETVPLSTIYRNLDMATVGHIHYPKGCVNIEGVPVDIPGSICNQLSRDVDIHDTVKLPIYEIDEESYKKSYLEVFLHTDLIEIVRTEERTALKETKVFNEQLKDTTYGNIVTMGLRDWLIAKNLSQPMVEAIVLASKNKLDSENIRDFYLEKENEIFDELVEAY